MWATTLKGVAGHKRRFLATCTAVLLGVAFLTATLVLGSTVERSFADMFTEAYQDTAVVVRDRTTIGSAESEQRGTVSPTTVEAVAGVDGVAAAVPVVEGTIQILGADGDPIGGDGPPTLGGTWIGEAGLNPYRLAEGRAPEAAGPDAPVEVVIDRGTADEGDIAVGDTTVVQTPAPTEVRIVGIATFGENDSMAGVTYSGMAAPDAQRLLASGSDEVSQVRVAADPGLTEAELASRVAAVLPQDDEAITGSERADELLDQINDDFLGAMSTMLLVFAGVAVLVAAFSIHNTFSIIAAQKTRESALLRAVGATRSQVLGSMLLESLAVGVLATAAGLAAGIGLGAGLDALLDTADVGFPQGGLVVTAGSVVAALVVGLLVTIVASLSPALHAARVAPVAAMRAAAVESRRISRVRLALGAVGLAAGVGLVASGAAGDGDLARVGLGSLAAVVGFLLVGPLVARWAGRVIGLPGRMLRGVTGRLAQENAVRNPRRTASTATALVIGIAVVSLFTIFGASLRASIEDEVTASFGATDLVVEATSFAGAGIGPGFAEEVEAIDGVRDVAPLRFGAVRLDGADEDATITDPVALDGVSDLGIVAGDLAALDAGTIAVSESYADDHDVTAGSTVEAGFADASTEALAIGAVYEARGALGDLIVPSSIWDGHATRQLGSQVVLLGADPGVDVDAVRSDVERTAERYGSPTVRDRQEYLDAVADQVNQVLAIVYVLLGVAVVIALLGIANTLALSIHERTHELGVLRAVGQTRSQLRAAVRWEALVVSVFGTAAGLGLGVLAGWGLVSATSGDLEIQTFAVPPTQMAVVLAVGALVGVLAAVRPARRAAKLDVLEALATD